MSVTNYELRLVLRGDHMSVLACGEEFQVASVPSEDT